MAHKPFKMPTKTEQFWFPINAMVEQTSTGMWVFQCEHFTITGQTKRDVLVDAADMLTVRVVEAMQDKFKEPIMGPDEYELKDTLDRIHNLNQESLN